MSVIQLSDSELSLLRMHTLQEYSQTAKKLEELNTILKKLGINNGENKVASVKEKTPVSKVVKTPAAKKTAVKAKAPVAKTTKTITPEVVVSAPKKRGRKPKAVDAIKTAPVKSLVKTATKVATKPTVKPAAEKTVAKVAPLKKVVAKGKKVSWAKFVTMTLKASKTPMSAPELLEAGKTQFNITDASRNKAMQALQATLFRLSKKSDVLGSEKTKGSFVGYFLKKK